VTLVENPTPFTISTSIYPDAAGLIREHNLDGEYGMTIVGMLEAIHEALEEAQATVNDKFFELAYASLEIVHARIHRPLNTNKISVIPIRPASADQLDNFEKMLKAAANILTDEAYWLPIVLDALPGIVSRMREEEATSGEKFRGVEAPSALSP